jgi:hypothetical protein
MSKRAITRLFGAAVAAVTLGIVLVLAAVWAAVASSVAVTVALAVVGGVAMLAGAAAAVVSWVAALLNTMQLDDKAWFVSLLVLGLFSCGLLAMVAYVLAGPDGTRQDAAPGGMPPALIQQNPEVQ